MLYFIIASFLGVIILALIIPTRVNLKYNVRHRPKNKKNNVLDDIINKNDSYPNENFFIVYIFYFIPILKFRLDRKKSKKKSKERNKQKIRNKFIFTDINSTVTNFLKSLINYKKRNQFYFSQKDIQKIHKHVKYKKVDFNLGVNFFDPVVNAYLIAIINAIINMFLAKKVNQFNLEKTTYNTYISKEIYNLRLECIFSVNLINVIFIILKILFKYLKLKHKIKLQSKSSNKKTLQVS